MDLAHLPSCHTGIYDLPPALLSWLRPLGLMAYQHEHGLWYGHHSFWLGSPHDTSWHKSWIISQMHLQLKSQNNTFWSHHLVGWVPVRSYVNTIVDLGLRADSITSQGLPSLNFVTFLLMYSAHIHSEDQLCFTINIELLGIFQVICQST